MVNGKWREGETAPTHGGWFQGRLDKTRMSGDAPAVEMTKMSDIFIFTPKFLKLQNIYIWTAYLLLYNLCPIKTHQRTHWVKLSLSLTVGHKTRGISPRCDPIYDPRIGPGIQLQSPTTFPSMSVSPLLITLFLATLTDSLELGEHCDFADLCSLGTRNNSICDVGQKFLIRVCDTYSFLGSHICHCRGWEEWGGSFWCLIPAPCQGGREGPWCCFSPGGWKSPSAPKWRTSPAG